MTPTNFILYLKVDTFLNWLKNKNAILSSALTHKELESAIAKIMIAFKKVSSAEVKIVIKEVWNGKYDEEKKKFTIKTKP